MHLLGLSSDLSITELLINYYKICLYDIGVLYAEK